MATEERIERLERQVAELNEFVDSVKPDGLSRRAAMRAAGTGALGILAGGYLSGRASAVPADSFVETGEIKGPNGNRHLDLQGGGPTLADQDLRPQTDDTQALGSASKRWADFHATQAEVNGDEVAGIGVSSSVSPSFGTWRQVSTTRPAYVFVNVRVETDGSNKASIIADVDHSGGTTRDYNVFLARLTKEAPSGTAIDTTTGILLQPGAQYRIRNLNDPNNANKIVVVEEYTL